MIHLKAKFKTKTIGNRTNYIYPEIWDAQRISVMRYEEPERKGGEQEEFCVIAVDDGYGKELLKQPNFEQITEKQADDLMKEWRK